MKLYFVNSSGWTTGKTSDTLQGESNIFLANSFVLFVLALKTFDPRLLEAANALPLLRVAPRRRAVARGPQIASSAVRCQVFEQCLLQASHEAGAMATYATQPKLNEEVPGCVDNSIDCRTTMRLHSNGRSVSLHIILRYKLVGPKSCLLHSLLESRNHNLTVDLSARLFVFQMLSIQRIGVTLKLAQPLMSVRRWWVQPGKTTWPTICTPLALWTAALLCRQKPRGTTRTWRCTCLSGWSSLFCSSAASLYSWSSTGMESADEARRCAARKTELSWGRTTPAVISRWTISDKTYIFQKMNIAKIFHPSNFLCDCFYIILLLELELLGFRFMCSSVNSQRTEQLNELAGPAPLPECTLATDKSVFIRIDFIGAHLDLNLEVEAVL